MSVDNLDLTFKGGLEPVEEPLADRVIWWLGRDALLHQHAQFVAVHQRGVQPAGLDPRQGRLHRRPFGKRCTQQVYSLRHGGGPERAGLRDECSESELKDRPQVLVETSVAGEAKSSTLS